MKEVHNFQVGDQVTVINNQPGCGEFFVEGEAFITAIVDGEDQYMVIFIHDGWEDKLEQRYVDPRQLTHSLEEIIEGHNND